MNSAVAMNSASLLAHRSRSLGIVLLSILAGAFSLVIPLEANAKPSWSKKTAISHLGIDVQNAKVVIGKDGTAIIVWVEEPIGFENGSVIRYMLRPAGKSKFNAAATLFEAVNPDTIASHNAVVAVAGNGSIIVAWTFRPSVYPTGGDIYKYIVKPAGSETFGAVQNFPRTSQLLTAIPALDYSLAANDAGVFWMAATITCTACGGSGQRVITWKGGVDGFADPQIASAQVNSSYEGAETPDIAVAPDGNAYLIFNLESDPTKTIINCHNGTSWFTADEAANKTPTGITLATGGESSDGVDPEVVTMTDGGALFTIREDNKYGLYTRASSWTDNGLVGATNSPLIPFGTEVQGHSVTADRKGNGLIAIGTKVGGKYGVQYRYVPSGGPASSKTKFIKSPSNKQPNNVDVSMDSVGNAVLAYSTTSYLQKNAYVAFRPAGASKQFKKEATFPTDKGVTFNFQVAMGTNKSAVLIFTATDKQNRDVLYYSTRKP